MCRNLKRPVEQRVLFNYIKGTCGISLMFENVSVSSGDKYQEFLIFIAAAITQKLCVRPQNIIAL